VLDVIFIIEVFDVVFPIVRGIFAADTTESDTNNIKQMINCKYLLFILTPSYKIL
jgi:hypothetical protein